MADLPLGVEGIEADHIAVKLHALQAVGIDADGGTALVGVQNLHVVSQGVGAQLGAVVAHLAGQGGGGQALDLDGVAVGIHPHQIALVQALIVGLIAVGAAVGTGHGDGAGVVGAALSVVVRGALHLGDDAIDEVVGRHGLAHCRHAAAAAQQQGHAVANLVAAQVGEGIGGGGGLNGVALARHGDGGGASDRGRSRLIGAGDLVGVGPQGMHGLRPVHHVLILHRGQAALGAVAVDRGAAGVEGHAGLPASGGHHGALHSGVDEGHPV